MFSDFFYQLLKLISLTAMVVIISFFCPRFTYMSISYVHFQTRIHEHSFGANISNCLANNQVLFFNRLFFHFAYKETRIQLLLRNKPIAVS